jgi:putative hemolysin
MDVVKICIFICIFLLLFALSAFFSGCETAILSLSPMQVQRVKERNRALGERLGEMLREPERLLSTLLIGNTFVNAALASVGYTFVCMLDVVPPSYEEAISILAVTLLVLLFGEISPKQFAIAHVEALVPVMVRTLPVACVVLSPFSWLLLRLTGPFKQALKPEARTISDEELVSVVNVTEEHGGLDREEGAMVRGILRLSELNASDVMTPRVDLIGLDVNDGPEEHLRAMRHAPFVWMPLWDDSADNFIDFVDVSKFLLDPKHDLEAARCHYSSVVPENIALDDLLILLYRSALPMVLVADEYGGTAGIVSRGDILELISLETEDHRNPVMEMDIRPHGPNCWIVAGDTSLEEINFQLGTHLEADDADRMSGWVTFHSGRIPKVGDKIEADGYRVTVQKMRRRKILSVIFEDVNPESREMGMRGEEDNGDFIIVEEGA